MNREIFTADTSMLSLANVFSLTVKSYIFYFLHKRHFIVLIASTTIKEQYMDWIRLVESKVRLLVQSLEKNQLISLVHINPQGYEEVKERQVFKIILLNQISSLSLIYIFFMPPAYIKILILVEPASIEF